MSYVEFNPSPAGERVKGSLERERTFFLTLFGRILDLIHVFLFSQDQSRTVSGNYLSTAIRSFSFLLITPLSDVVIKTVHPEPSVTQKVVGKNALS